MICYRNMKNDEQGARSSGDDDGLCFQQKCQNDLCADDHLKGKNSDRAWW
jgi:hypothetical protein